MDSNLVPDDDPIWAELGILIPDDCADGTKSEGLSESSDGKALCDICNKRAGCDLTCRECAMCGKQCCLECIGPTSCQTTWALCSECYDYACSRCGDTLPPDCGPYLDDGEPINKCVDCLENRSCPVLKDELPCPCPDACGDLRTEWAEAREGLARLKAPPPPAGEAVARHEPFLLELAETVRRQKLLGSYMAQTDGHRAHRDRVLVVIKAPPRVIE